LFGLSARVPLEVKEGSLFDAAAVSGALAGVDAVVHLVGIIREFRDQTFERVHVGTTGRLLVAMQRAGVTRLVHMSALGTRPGAVSRYHQTKWAAEELVRRSGLEATIFRPSIIFGPGDSFVNMLAGMVRRSPVVPVMGSGRGRFQPVSVEQVAACFTGALRDPRAAGVTCDLCGPETLTFTGILDEIESVLGVRRWRVHVPMRVAWAQAALLEWVCPLLRFPPPLTRDQLTMLEEDILGDGGLAGPLWPVQPVSFREGIRRYLKPPG
jgi:NADH dehydrogenase